MNIYDEYLFFRFVRFVSLFFRFFTLVESDTDGKLSGWKFFFSSESYSKDTHNDNLETDTQVKQNLFQTCSNIFLQSPYNMRQFFAYQIEKFWFLAGKKKSVTE